MKFFLVVVITFAGKPADPWITRAFDTSDQCEVARNATAEIAKKLVGTRKTDGTLVTDATGVCIEGTATDPETTIQTKAIQKLQAR